MGIYITVGAAMAAITASAVADRQHLAEPVIAAIGHCPPSFLAIIEASIAVARSAITAGQGRRAGH